MPKTLAAILALLLVFLSLATGRVKKKEPQSSSIAAAAPQKPAFDGLDGFITQAMKDWKVPGLAITVVRDGKIILTKGYGYRDSERKLPVTPNTLFCVASMTQSFVVTELGALVDEGKLDLDKPVYDYLQDFRMYDSVVTERLTPRDLVTHRSGLPRHDLTRPGTATTMSMLGPLTCSALTVIAPVFPTDELVSSLTMRLMPPGNEMARLGLDTTTDWPAAAKPTSSAFPLTEA